MTERALEAWRSALTLAALRLSRPELVTPPSSKPPFDWEGNDLAITQLIAEAGCTDDQRQPRLFIASEQQEFA